MGLEIDREHFAPGDYARFGERLAQCLEALEAVLARPGFGAGPGSVGAELEVSLVDREARPLPRNAEVLDETRDPRLTVELDRFNLECNLNPFPLAGRPFAALRAELSSAIAELERCAAGQGGRIAVIGILPTLRVRDLGAQGMTDRRRYRALSAAIRARRQGPFRLRIHGQDELDTTCEDVTFEGAASAFQLHLRVAPERFAEVFNATQMATAPILAASGNSPTFLGRLLWDETRVALFKQAVDDRGEGTARTGESRVSFGRGWARGSAVELFREPVALHPPLLPVVDAGEGPLAGVGAGNAPSLRELRLHQSTVWSWNRPIYDPADGGHLRIEMRALPAGPSIADMLANAAFLLGLSLDLSNQAESWRRGFPFDDAHHNFYRAAQLGLHAELAWPPEPGAPSRPVGARELVLSLVPRAQAGLDAAGIDREDSEPLLAILAERAGTGRTGAVWQRAALSRLEAALPREEALAAMLQRYLTHTADGRPVHTWPVP
jgi:gamma-glutamyl:cysteine ligase YbdK (ATP-grasp superfamily)